MSPAPITQCIPRRSIVPLLILGSLILAARMGFAQDWQVATDGDWDNVLKWSNPSSVPDAAGAEVTLTAGTYTIGTSGPPEFTLGGLLFGGGNISLDGFSLIFSNNTNPAALQIQDGGSLTLAAGLRLASDIEINLHPSATLSLGSIEAAAGGSRLELGGGGTISLAGGFSGGNITLAMELFGDDGPPFPTIQAGGGNASYSGNITVETGAVYVTDAAFFGDTDGITTLGVTGVGDPFSRLAAIYVGDGLASVDEDIHMVNGAILKLDSTGNTSLTGNIHVAAGEDDIALLGTLWFGALSPDPPAPGNLTLSGSISGDGNLAILANFGASVIFNADADVLGNEFTGNLFVGPEGLEVSSGPGDRVRLVLQRDGGFGDAGLFIGPNGTVLLDGPGNGSLVDRFHSGSVTYLEGGELLLQNNSTEAGVIGLGQGTARIDFGGSADATTITFAGGLMPSDGWDPAGALRIDGYGTGDSLVISDANGFLTPDQASQVGFLGGDGFYLMSRQDTDDMSPTAGEITPFTSNDFHFTEGASGAWNQSANWIPDDSDATGLVPNSAFAKAIVANGAGPDMAMDVTGNGTFSLNQLLLEAAAGRSTAIASGIDVRLSSNGSREALLVSEGSGAATFGGNVRFSEDVRVANTGIGLLSFTGVETTLDYIDWVYDEDTDTNIPVETSGDFFTSLISSGRFWYEEDGVIPGSGPQVIFDTSGGDIVVSGGFFGDFDIAKTGNGMLELAGPGIPQWQTSQNADVQEGTLRLSGDYFQAGFSLAEGTTLQLAPTLSDNNYYAPVSVSSSNRVSMVEAASGSAEIHAVNTGEFSTGVVNGEVRLLGGELVLRTDADTELWIADTTQNWDPNGPPLWLLNGPLTQDTPSASDASVRKVGEGALNLGGDNTTLLGQITINDGTLALRSARALGSSAAALGTLVHGMDGGEELVSPIWFPNLGGHYRANLRLDINEPDFVGTHEVFEAITLDTGSLVVGFTQDVHLRGPLSIQNDGIIFVEHYGQAPLVLIDELTSTGDLTVRGANDGGGLVLTSSDNTFSGNLFIESSRVTLTDLGALSTADSISVGRDSPNGSFGMLAFDVNSVETFAENVTLRSWGVIRNDGAGDVALDGTLTLNGAIDSMHFYPEPEFAGSGNFVVSTLENGSGLRAGSFRKSGSGTLSIESAQTFGTLGDEYSQGSEILVTGGTLRLAADDAAGQTWRLSVFSGGTLALDGSATDRIAPETEVYLNGGTIQFAQASSEAVGTLIASMEASTIDFGGFASTLDVGAYSVWPEASLIIDNYEVDESKFLVTATPGRDTVARTVFSDGNSGFLPASYENGEILPESAGSIFVLPDSGDADWFTADSWDVDFVPNSLAADVRITPTNHLDIEFSQGGNVFMNRLFFGPDGTANITIAGQTDTLVPVTLVMGRPTEQLDVPALEAIGASTGDIVIGANVRFERAGVITNSKTDGVFDLAGGISAPYGTVVMVAGSGSTTLSGGIDVDWAAGAVQINKAGDGDLILGGGASNVAMRARIDVQAGTLIFARGPDYSGLRGLKVGDGASLDSTGLAGALVVEGGNSVSGTGTLRGEFAFGAGGSINPGNSPGTLTQEGDLTLAGGGVYVWEVADFAAAPGVGYDTYVVNAFDDMNGDIALTATDVDPFVIQLVTLDAFNEPGMAANFFASSAGQWTLFSYEGSFNSFSASAFTVDASLVQNFTNGTWSVQHNASEQTVNLVYAPVPEPAPLGVLSVAVAMARLVRRRCRTGHCQSEA